MYLAKLQRASKARILIFERKSVRKERPCSIYTSVVIVQK